MDRVPLRRRRFGAGALLVLALSLSAPRVASAVTGSAQGPASGDRYVVRAGDTLWAVAVTRAPGRDPRPMIQAIVDANQIDPGALVPGQVLVIPA